MTQVREARYDQCVDALYRTLLTPASLGEALGHMASLFDATGTSFIRTDEKGIERMFVCHGFDTSLQKVFIDHYAPMDPAKTPMLSGRTGVWFQDDNAFDPRHTLYPEYVADFAPKAGIRWFRGGKVHAGREGASFIGVMRRPDARPFDGSTLGLLDRLFPHLARLSRLLSEMERLPLASAASQAAAESLSTGVCVVDSLLQVVYANKAALSMIAVSGSLQIRSNMLAGSSLSVQGRLRNAVSLATGTPRQARSFSPNPDDALPQRLQVRVLPLDEKSELVRTPGGPFALVFISRGTSPLRADELVQLFALTPSEGELVRLLSQGLSPTNCADRRGVSVATVRTQLKFVYAKTGVSSLPQLMSLVLALPGLRHASVGG